MSKEIVNRVAQSTLVQISMDDYLPKQGVVAFDLEPHLYEGMILREKDFQNDMPRTLNKKTLKSLYHICPVH